MKSTVFVNAPAGLIYPGDSGFPDGKWGLEKQWWNFSPRLGLAWDLNGDGRMAVRSSYGIPTTFPPPNATTSTRSRPVRQPPADRNPPGRSTIPIATSAEIPTRSSPTQPSSSSPFGAYGAIDPTSTRRASRRGTSRSSDRWGRTGAGRSYLGSYTDRLWKQIDLIPASSWARTLHAQGVSFPVCTTAANVNQRRDLSLSGEKPVGCGAHRQPRSAHRASAARPTAG